MAAADPKVFSRADPDSRKVAAVVLPEVYNPVSEELVAPRYEYGYDAFGNQTLIRDPLGRETVFSYDNFGQQLTRTLPQIDEEPNLVETTVYDLLGRIETITDFKGHTTEYVYDEFGRRTAKNLYEAEATTPSETIESTYDAWGRLDLLLEARGTTDYDYDARGNLVQIVSPEGTIGYEYDLFGRLTRTYTANSDI